MALNTQELTTIGRAIEVLSATDSTSSQKISLKDYKTAVDEALRLLSELSKVSQGDRIRAGWARRHEAFADVAKYSIVYHDGSSVSFNSVEALSKAIFLTASAIHVYFWKAFKSGGQRGVFSRLLEKDGQLMPATVFQLKHFPNGLPNNPVIGERDQRKKSSEEELAAGRGGRRPKKPFTKPTW